MIRDGHGSEVPVECVGLPDSSGNQGLLLRLRLGRRLDCRLGVGGGAGLQIFLGRGGEIGRLEGRLLLGGLDERLGLGGVIAHVLLGHLGSLLCVLLGDGAELGRLGIDHVAGMLELRVDELLVGGVDEGREEDDGSGEHGQAPVGDDLDEVVRREGGQRGLEFSAGQLTTV